MRPFLLLGRRLEVSDEGRRGQLHHLLARGAAHGEVGGDEADAFAAAKLSGELLEHGVRMGRVADLERTVRPLLADTVEDHHSAGALEGHEARKPVDELTRIRERARVEDVVTVEEIESRFSHRSAACAPRRGERPRRH